MASYIKKGESIFIPFRNGKSISDSQCKPRIYKTMKAFERSFPGHYLGTDGVELMEYSPVVHCKECFWGIGDLICTNPHCSKSFYGCPVAPDHFCSYGERITNEP